MFLFEIFAFFKRSSTRIGTLHEKEDENYLDEVGLIKPITFRWLSHSKAINRLIDILIPIVETLIEYSDETTAAVGLLQTLQDPEVILTIHFLADLLNILAILNKTFQNKLLMISNIEGIVENTISRIKSTYLSENSDYGEKLRDFLKCVTNSLNIKNTLK